MKRIVWMIGLLCLSVAAVAWTEQTWGSGRPLFGQASDLVRSVPGVSPRPETVMAIGGSVAYGWVDPKGGGYLARAFATMQQKTGRVFHFVNKAIVGANSTQLNITLYKGRYTSWLSQVKPQVTVISWGLLNDCLPNTPLPRFESTIRGEIQKALDRHSVVLMVTPPVTKASYTQYLEKEPVYVNSEVYVADSFDSPNVVTFDLFDQMKAYIAAHNLNYMQFQTDGWHPNAAGHTLAGKILAQDMLRRYGDGPIRFRSATDSAARAQVQ